jgi:hypothetical protein
MRHSISAAFLLKYVSSQIDRRKTRELFLVVHLPTGHVRHLGVSGVTDDYYRHGAATFFAALDVADGSVTTQCKPRRRHQELSSFLRHIDTQVPAELDVHLIVDSHATYKYA